MVIALALGPLSSAGVARESAYDDGCSDLIEDLVVKVEANYPGYRVEVVGTAAESGYRARLAELRRAARVAGSGVGCLRVLQSYVAWFKDGHLFVGGRPPVLTAADSARFEAAAPRVAWTRVDVMAYLDRTGNDLDPVEGIWIGADGLEFAVVAEGMGSAGARSEPGRFLAFVLEAPEPDWAAGDVKAELTLLPDGSYDAVLYNDLGVPTRVHVYARDHEGAGRLQRGGLLLHMPPDTWGKLYPLRPEQEGRLDPVDPRAPTASTIGTDVVVFHVPSHVPTHARRLNALIEQYRSALGRAETLIIDLRGNEGGSAFVTDPLMPFLVTHEKKPPRYLTEGEPAVLASQGNADYFGGESWAPSGLAERLRRAEPGSLVPLADPSPKAPEASEGSREPEEPERPTARPRQVAILTDAMTVSAAEAFVLQAMQNTKVTLFGQPTGANIDYQSVRLIRFGVRAAGLYVGYPTVVGSDRLPEGGVRPTGIVPDVWIDPADPDPVGRILEYYARHR